MSVCFSHARRVLFPAANTARHITSVTAASTSITLPTNAANRQFSAAKSKKAKKDETAIPYAERKAAAKQLRRERYNAHQARLERLQVRRDNSPKDVKKNIFRSWWDKELLYHAHLIRAAKKEGKPWKMRVAAMVERLPVVQPDIPDWEMDYMQLRAYLDTYGKEYPPETGFMAPDAPEHHIVETHEEMLAGLPFTPAPRETEHDHSGNVKTLDRRLKTRVYLAVQSDAEGNKTGPRWTLPSVVPKNEETLLQAAQRAVSDAAGDQLTLWCPGNAPMAVNFRVYNKNLPEEFRGNYYGEKIFYYRVQWDSGDVDESACLKNGFKDYAWLTREEIVERVVEERGEHQAKFFHYML
jgi:large subunit ribosomal protein L46